MERPKLEYEVESQLGFQETVDAIVAAVPDYKMAVLSVLDMAKLLVDKGFPHEPLVQIEVCNARMAADALAEDPRVALIMPCPIVVAKQGEKVRVSTLDTRILSQLYEGSRLPELGDEMYGYMCSVLNTVA